MVGKLLPRLNMSKRPIVDNYREVNVKRTLKREGNSPRNLKKGSDHLAKPKGRLCSPNGDFALSSGVV